MTGGARTGRAPSSTRDTMDHYAGIDVSLEQSSIRVVGRKRWEGRRRDVERGIRGLPGGFGRRVGPASKVGFAARIRELVAGQAMLERVVERMLRAGDALRVEFHGLHRTLLRIVRA